MTKLNDKLPIGALLCLVASLVPIMFGHWIAGLAIAVWALPLALLWRRQTGRARRGGSESAAPNLNLGAVGVGLTTVGLLCLGRLAVGVGSGEGSRAIVLLGPITIGSLTLGLRFLTGARLMRQLRRVLGAEPVLVGTGEKISSRLRGMGLADGELLAATSSLLGKPEDLRRIPLQSITSVDTPELAAVRVRYRDDQSFCVWRGSLVVAQRFAQEVRRQTERPDERVD